MSSITGTILDYIGGRDDKTKGHEPLFIAAFLVLIGFLCLDVYANLKGVEYVSQRTTEAVSANQSEAVFDKIQSAIASKEATLDKLTRCQIKGYCWQGHLTADGRSFQQALTSDIAALRQQQSALISSALSEHQQDQTRFAEEVNLKRKSHIRLVWFAYPIAFLICFIVQHFVDQAIAHVTSQVGGSVRGSAMGYSSPVVENGHHPIGYHQGGNATLTDPDAEYLAKWQEAVELILAGHTNKEVMRLYTGPQKQIRGTTIQKLKTVLRTQGLLSPYPQN